MNRALLAVSAFILGAAAGFGIAAYLTYEYVFPHPKPVESPAYVHRSLSLRIDNLDKLSHSRGDRYRLFDCREVPRR